MAELCLLSDTNYSRSPKVIESTAETLPSVLWCCWVCGRKGVRPVKNMVDGGGGHWLVQMEWRPAGWSVCLSLLIFPCTIKSEVLFWHRLTWWSRKKGRKTVVVYWNTYMWTFCSCCVVNVSDTVSDCDSYVHLRSDVASEMRVSMLLFSRFWLCEVRVL